jgi:hypothetical protein
MLKRIYKVVGHDMYIINILVCGPYGKFQNKICLIKYTHFCDNENFSNFV